MGALAGKVALVTGGSRGIGAAIARRLAADGADVALTYAAAADKAEAVVAEIAAGGRRARAYRSDAADAVAPGQAVAKAVADFGRLDILVANAGIFLAGPIEELTLEAYEQTMAVNVRAVFLAAQAAAGVMPRGGRLIGIGSCLAERVPGPGMALYAASKAALIGLFKGLARDLGPRAITANLVHPGPTDTDMNPADSAKAEGQRGLLAVGRYGAAAEIAAAVAHLASPDAAYTTGASLYVDGGYTA
jgi:NAD(P)-dependent dehydrogenase (short-subunit alcohol dehydrogenase family)